MGLHFSRDGVLRRSVTTRDPDTGAFTTRRIPLRALEAARGRSLFLSTLQGPFGLEEGITVGEILTNLAPWTDLVSELALIDLGAYLEEIACPATRDTEVSHIRLAPHAEIGPVPGYDRDELFDEDGRLQPGNPVYTGQVCLTFGWDLAAVLKEEAREAYGGEEIVSLSLSPLRDWHHLPVVVTAAGMLHDTTAATAHEFLGTATPLTDPDHPNVRVIHGRSSDSVRHEIGIETHGVSVMSVIVEGFLHELGFHGTPGQTDAVRADLDKRMAEMKGEVVSEDAEAEQAEISRDRAEHAALLALFEDADRKAEELGLPVSQPGGASA